jgi:amino acid adenylation domain-containing protein
MTIWEAFADQARRQPSAAAVTGAAAFTYRELEDRALKVAHEVRENCEPGSLIALSATGPTAGAVAFLAAANAGCALLPLNADSPPMHRAAVLADARVEVLLREGPGHDLTVERVEGDHAAGAAGRWPDTMLDVAYVLYTSGSTGRPKGVVIPHQALLDRLHGLARVPGLGQGESFLAMTALSFDISVAEMLLPLLVGGTMVAAPEGARFDPAVFAAAVDELRPDVIQSTPSFWRLTLAWGWPGAPGSRLWCGGEPLTPALADQLLSCGRELWNVYGPTEATIWASAGRIRPGEPIGLGQPLDGTGLCLSDEAGQVLALPGQPGEILLYGAGLALGYLNQPDLTARMFHTADTPDGPMRCYRTGDRARYRDDGGIEFLGRVDAQVKLRGHRIELGELEAVMERHPAVREAVALLRDSDRPERTHIAAFVIADGGLTPRQLRDWLADRLPPHMHPSRFHFQQGLPRTTAGKVDRVALAAA